jgi:predicted dehydrogenase
MNFGVIGTFWLTKQMICAMNQVPDAIYAGQYSRSLDRAKTFADNWNENIILYNSLDALAQDSRIDAVYIASPNAFHYEQCKELLLSGKHILCEKPICVQLDQLKELYKISDNKNTILMEAMMNVHLPWAFELKQQLKNLGKTILVRFDFCQRSSKLETVRSGKKVSTFDKSSGGGVLMDLGVYALSLCVYLFGKPQSCFAKANYFESGVDITDTVILEYPDFHAVLTFSKLAESRSRSEIICENGTVTIGTLSQLQNVVRWNLNNESHLLHGTNEGDMSMTYELSDFLDFTTGKKMADYQFYKDLSLCVSELMDKIKIQITR